jgi:hypothetical protein
MKKLIESASLVCSALGFASLASAAPITLNCTETAGNGTMTLTISGDSAGDTIQENVVEVDTGLSYSEDGSFKDFENHGKDAVYTVSDGETETSVSDDLITGKITKGSAGRHIIGFSGGPGEAGWPDQQYNYSCTR